MMPISVILFMKARYNYISSSGKLPKTCYVTWPFFNTLLGTGTAMDGGVYNKVLYMNMEIVPIYQPKKLFTFTQNKYEIVL